MIKRRYSALIIALVITFAAFASGRALYALDDDSSNIKVCESCDLKKYSPYLIDADLYKRGGESLHKKYTQELLCMSAVLVERQDIAIIERSVGFYHDRFAGSRSPFYLGFEVRAEYDGSQDYGRFCTRMIRENVSGIAEEALNVYGVLDEQEVAGVVVTFRWNWNSQEGNVTIWLKEEDIRLFNSSKITASELYQRSTITNTGGKVILLPI